MTRENRSARNSQNTFLINLMGLVGSVYFSGVGGYVMPFTEVNDASRGSIFRVQIMNWLMHLPNKGIKEAIVYTELVVKRVGFISMLSLRCAYLRTQEMVVEDTI